MALYLCSGYIAIWDRIGSNHWIKLKYQTKWNLPDKGPIIIKQDLYSVWIESNYNYHVCEWFFIHTYTRIAQLKQKTVAEKRRKKTHTEKRRKKQWTWTNVKLINTQLSNDDTDRWIFTRSVCHGVGFFSSSLHSFAFIHFSFQFIHSFVVWNGCFVKIVNSV